MRRFILIFLLYLASAYFFDRSHAENLTFVVFGDIHLQDIASDGEKILSRIVENINSHKPKPEFAVCLGDIVGYPSSIDPVKYVNAIDKYLMLTEKLVAIPVYTIPGNHDLEGGEKFRDIFQAKIGPLFFSIEKKGVLLIFLNSEDFSGEQLSWLNNQLKNKSMKLVFTHKPVFPVFANQNYSLDLKTSLYLRGSFMQNNVIAVFSGHEHFFYQKKSGKIMQIISGGAGGRLAPVPENGKSAHHYCIITVTETGSVITEPVIIEK